MPATWAAYGVDANRDGHKDPFNPVDAIFAAARYLARGRRRRPTSGARSSPTTTPTGTSTPCSMRAEIIGGLPGDLIGSLTGLTQGRFPIYGASRRYPGQVDERARRAEAGDAAMRRASPNRAAAARCVIRARPGAGAVIAVNDGRVVRIGKTRSASGASSSSRTSTATPTPTGTCGKIAATYPAPTDQRGRCRAEAADRQGARRLPRRRRPGPRRRRRDPRTPATSAAVAQAASRRPRSPRRQGAPVRPPDAPQRRRRGHAAAPRPARRPRRRRRSGSTGATTGQAASNAAPAWWPAPSWAARPRQARGARPHLLQFEVRPAGHGAPRIDPKPILDGWQLLESTAIYGARERRPVLRRRRREPRDDRPAHAHGQGELAAACSPTSRIKVYGCGRRDIRTGQVDRRVLATLVYLAASGLDPTVTSLRCGHST